MRSTQTEQMDDDKVTELLAVPPLRVDEARALARFRASAVPTSRRWLPLRALQGLAATAAVVLVASALTLSGLAESFLQIFEPKTFVAVSIDPNSLSALPDLSAYGKLTWQTAPSPRPVATLADATREAGFAPARVGTLPAGVSGDPKLAVLPKTSGTFTFSASAATAAAAKMNRTPPPMPSGIDGATLTGSAGPAVMQVWAGGGGREMPGLVVAQGRVPSVSSDGVTLATLQAYLLAQPGFPPQLAAQLRAISDPSTTLPVPIPAGQSSKSVTVNGAEGLFIGDLTGIGSGVIWRRGEFLYAVGGPLTEAQVLAVANSLR